MNIVVLAGGLSPEREVSLSSGSLIANALTKEGHRVALVDLYLGLPELPKDSTTLFSSLGQYEHPISERIPDLEELRRASGNGKSLIGKNVLGACRKADLVFLALHGGIGENGQVQAMLDAYGIPYTGSPYDGSLLAMNKDLSKRLLRGARIPTPDWALLDDEPIDPEKLWQAFGGLLVVKPIGCGSSVGVSLPESKEELTDAIAEAAKWGKVIVEKRIKGRELALGILGDEVLPPVEILPKSGFYDYRNKYQGTTREVCPATLPDGVWETAGELAKKAFRILHLSGYARFDLMLDEENNVWFLEANTLPGMTPNSLLPKAAAAAGFSYEALCRKIVELALAR